MHLVRQEVGDVNFQLMNLSHIVTKIDFIMKNVLQFDIKTSTTQKEYMHGFQGFANVVKKINMKLSKNKFVSELDAWAVDVDYNSYD